MMLKNPKQNSNSALVKKRMAAKMKNQSPIQEESVVENEDGTHLQRDLGFRANFNIPLPVDIMTMQIIMCHRTFSRLLRFQRFYILFK